MNLTCEHIEERLSDYADGVLWVAESPAFAPRVESCSHCAPLVAGFGSLVLRLHGLPHLETPPRLVYNILDATLGPRDSVTGWGAVIEWMGAPAAPRFVFGTASLVATVLIVASAAGFFCS